MSELKKNRAGAITLGFVSLGCPKNQIDAEIMLGKLAPAGYVLTTDPTESEIIVINTCGFIESAKEESINTILEMAELKESGSCKRLIVTGCLSHRYREELSRDIPEIDAILTLDDLREITSACERKYTSITSSPAPAKMLFDSNDARFATTPLFSRYIKAAEGCDHQCSFCAIPTFRGALRSRSVADICAEADKLVSEGAVELCLVAQDLGAFAKDKGKADLPSLLKEMVKIDGLEWLRLHYVYPPGLTLDLQEMMAVEKKIVPYLDIPFQHGSPKVLKDMLRPGSAEGMLRKIEELRSNIPDLALRTSIIVGFPTETEAEYQELLQFVETASFDHLGVFTYSHEEGTSAFDKFEDVVPQEVKDQRQAGVMELQQQIALEKNEAKIGKSYDCLVEGLHPESELLLAGRLTTQAPEVDGTVIITDGVADAGDIVKVTIEEAYPYDLTGVINE